MISFCISLWKSATLDRARLAGPCANPLSVSALGLGNPRYVPATGLERMAFAAQTLTIFQCGLSAQCAWNYMIVFRPAHDLELAAIAMASVALKCGEFRFG